MLKNMYEKKINKTCKKFRKANKKLFSKWAYYVENAKWDDYKNIEYITNFNFEFDMDKVSKVLNSALLEIPEIQESSTTIFKLNNDLDMKVEQFSLNLQKCFFSENFTNSPFIKVDSLEYIKEYIKNFPKLYAEICSVVSKNNNLIFDNLKKSKSVKCDKRIWKEYANLLNAYRKHNKDLYDVCTYILQCDYIIAVKMYMTVGASAKFNSDGTICKSL